jgi:AraC-like DNA-binding protein
VVLEKIHSCDELPKVNYSEYLSQKLGYDYTYLANVFSEACGSPIQQFIIHHKIEKVKELMFYNELNISEISYKLNYSSVAHLSNQFKKITGLPPSAYKNVAYHPKENPEMVS